MTAFNINLDGLTAKQLRNVQKFEARVEGTPPKKASVTVTVNGVKQKLKFNPKVDGASTVGFTKAGETFTTFTAANAFTPPTTGGGDTGSTATGRTIFLTTNQDAPGAQAPAANTTGSSGSDTYIAVLDSPGAATTLQAIDFIDGLGGNDTLQILAIGAGPNAVTPLFLSNVETVSVKDVEATRETTVDLANSTGVTTVLNDGSVGDIDFQNIGAAAVSVKGVATNAATVFTRGATPVTSALTINVENHGTDERVGAAAVAGGNINSDDGNNDATAVVVNASGFVRMASMNVTGEVATAATHTATSVTLNAAGSTTFTTGITGFDTTAAGTFTVTGAGKVGLGTLAGAVKTLNASASTGGVTAVGSTYTGTAAGVSNGLVMTGGSGGDAFTLNGVATAVVNAGAGNDTVTVVGGTLTAGASLDGGAGTDTLVLDSADAVAAGANTTAGAALRATYSNFETLAISNALAGTLEAGRLGFGNSVRFDGASGGRTVNGLNDGATLTFRAATGGALIATVTGAATSTTDSLNLNLAANLNQGDNVVIGVGINGVNNINISANDRTNNVQDDAAAVGASDNGPDEGYTVVLTDAASLNVVTISGTSQVVYAADVGSTALRTINATASSGNNTLDISAFVGLERVTVNAGNGENFILGSDRAFGDALNGGTGNDVIDAGEGADVVRGGGGRDIFVVAAGDSDATTSGFDKISDFGLVTSAITAAVNGAFPGAAGFQGTASNPGGANVDVLDLVGTPTLGGLQADVNVNLAGLQAAAGTDIIAGDVITASESAKGLLTLGGAAASKVNTLAEWIAVANIMAGTNGDVVAFVFGGNTYIFQQDAADDVLIELTGVNVTGTSGFVIVGAANAVAVGDILIA